MTRKVDESHISDLQYDPRNARKRTIRSSAMIQSSLQEVGASRSIVIDEHNRILAGNGTIEAAGQIGIEKMIIVDADGETIVAVRRSGLTEQQKIKLALFDNRTSDLSEWDADVLAELSQEIDLTGLWSEDELSNLLASQESGEGSGEEDEEKVSALIDEAESGAIESRVSLGQIWKLGRHTIACGDSTSELNVKKLLGDRMCDLCFTSPPYNLGSSVGLRNGSFKGKDNAYVSTSDSLNEQEYLALLRKFLENAFLISKYQLINIQSLAGNKKSLFQWVGEFSDRLADVFIWSKTNPQPAMAEKVANSAFEFIFAFSSGKNPKRSIDVAAFDRGRFSNVYTSAVGNNSHTDGLHGATFPVEIASHYLSNFSETASIIYEPFLGSGTTLIAAQQMEGTRSIIGFELSPEYCEVICRRFESLTGINAELVGNLTT